MKKIFLLFLLIYLFFASVNLCWAQMTINFTEGSATMVSTAVPVINFQLRAFGTDINGGGVLGANGFCNPCNFGHVFRGYNFYSSGDILGSSGPVIVNGRRYQSLAYNGQIIFDSEPMRVPLWWPRRVPLTLTVPATLRGTLRGYKELPQSNPGTPLFTSQLNLNGRLIVRLSRTTNNNYMTIQSAKYEFAN